MLLELFLRLIDLYSGAPPTIIIGYIVSFINKSSSFNGNAVIVLGAVGHKHLVLRIIITA